MNCEVCKKPLTKKNTADGVSGYEIREVLKEAPTKTHAKEACRSCYLAFYKKKYPEAKPPKLS